MAAVRVSWGEKPASTSFSPGGAPDLKSSTFTVSPITSSRSALAVTLKGPSGPGRTISPGSSITSRIAGVRRPRSEVVIQAPVRTASAPSRTRSVAVAPASATWAR